MENVPGIGHADTLSFVVQVTPSRQGYEYAGRVQFVQQQRGGVPVLQLGEFSAAAERQDVTHQTVMVTRSGQAYTKRWIRFPYPCHWSEMSQVYAAE